MTDAVLMTESRDQSVGLVRTRDRTAAPIDYRYVRRALASETATRIAPGTYAPTKHWQRLKPIEQHLLRVREALARSHTSLVLSHLAAAARWDIDILGSWPKRVDTRVERASGGRASGLLRRHAWGVHGVDVAEWEGHHVTSPAQTAVDLASVLSYTSAVVVMDQVLWTRREGGALATAEAIRRVIAESAPLRGIRKIERAFAFATSLSDSVRESQSRVVIHELGFPTPILQHPIKLLDGRWVYPDFYFGDFDHAAEFDGVGKYLDPGLLKGRTPGQALIAEKDRADGLARVVSKMSRWRTPALRDPRILYDILVAAGLPTRKQRPSKGVVWE
ncbi:hypothetical protein GCM10027421_05470 [Microbacterium shaanxiense]